ncbi:agamous-like MADS-box protein AGL80 [Pyrus communis]|uniref:agamous-like MADS-box protein AGL80 n=1 Tax=Pyrus communis TaxID=23211 RepID=UPI0035C26AFB
MTRKKIKLAYIRDDVSRKVTFKKRKNGLMKKVKELSILCGIDVSAIVYSQYDTKPDVGSCRDVARRIVTRFKQMPERDKSRNMLNQESFLRQQILKAEEQLKKQIKENQEKEIMVQSMRGSLPGDWLQNLSGTDLNGLLLSIEKNIEAIEEEMQEA